jgi:hypothetical protein
LFSNEKKKLSGKSPDVKKQISNDVGQSSDVKKQLSNGIGKFPDMKKQLSNGIGKSLDEGNQLSNDVGKPPNINGLFYNYRFKKTIQYQCLTFHYQQIKSILCLFPD